MYIFLRSFVFIRTSISLFPSVKKGKNLAPLGVAKFPIKHDPRWWIEAYLLMCMYVSQMHARCCMAFMCKQKSPWENGPEYANMKDKRSSKLMVQGSESWERACSFPVVDIPET